MMICQILFRKFEEWPQKWLELLFWFWFVVWAMVLMIAWFLRSFSWDKISLDKVISWSLFNGLKVLLLLDTCGKTAIWFLLILGLVGSITFRFSWENKQFELIWLIEFDARCARLSFKFGLLHIKDELIKTGNSF